MGPFSRTQELRRVRTSPYAGGVKGRIDMTGDRGGGERKRFFFCIVSQHNGSQKKKRYCSKKIAASYLRYLRTMYADVSMLVTPLLQPDLFLLHFPFKKKKTEITIELRGDTKVREKKEGTQLNWDHKMSLAKKRTWASTQRNLLLLLPRKKCKVHFYSLPFFFFELFPVQKGSCLGGKEGLLVG